MIGQSGVGGFGDAIIIGWREWSGDKVGCRRF